MTTPTLPPPDGWDDERLDAAFAARARKAPATPHDLGVEVLERVGARRSNRLGWAPVPALALGLVLIALLPGITNRAPTPSGSGLPAGASGPPPASAKPDPVLEALGEPLTVSEALAVRDGEIDQQEILVKGFLSPPPSVQCMALTLHPHPLLGPICGVWHWLMESPEDLRIQTSSVVAGMRNPTGPAFLPSFALVGSVEGPLLRDMDEPVPIVVLGHFNDRRANTCGDKEQECRERFLVDRLVEVNGQRHKVTTYRRTEVATKDAADVVDALAVGAAPGAVVVSRQLITVGDAVDVEPILAKDAVIPSWGDRSAPFWIVTTVDLSGDVPLARTFALIDGSNWFAEITAESAVYLERTAPEPSTFVPPAMPSADPAAFDAAPATVLGIPVRDIATLQRDRRAAMDALGREEFAVRAWYLAPDPAVTCDDAPPPIHEPRPPCDEARHWLLDDLRQYGTEPGQRRTNPAADHFTPVLNPLLPIDVPFEVGETWRDGTPAPRPVIVLGHFNDHRVDTYAGNLYFVIDALAWTPETPAQSLDTVTRFTPLATEDVASVVARINAIDPREAVATWVRVADPADFVQMDRRSSQMPEFTSGAPVWAVARLIPDQRDDRERLAVVWGFTADGGTRVWREECPDCSPDLATTLDIHDLDANTPLVRVYDYDQSIVVVGPANGLSGLDWQKPEGNATDYLDVARGRTSRELVLRWRSPSTCDVPWDVTVRRSEEYGIYISPSIRGEGCSGETVTRRIVIEFEDPVDMDRIQGPSCCG